MGLKDLHQKKCCFNAPKKHSILYSEIKYFHPVEIENNDLFNTPFYYIFYKIVFAV